MAYKKIMFNIDIYSIILTFSEPIDVLCSFQFVSKEFYDLVQRYGCLSLPKISDGLIVQSNYEVYMLLPFWTQKKYLNFFNPKLVYGELSIMKNVDYCAVGTHLAIRDQRIIALVDRLEIDLFGLSRGAIPVHIWYKWSQLKARKNTYFVGILGNTTSVVRYIRDLKENMCLHAISAPINVHYKGGLTAYISKLALAEHFLEQHKSLLNNVGNCDYLTNHQCTSKRPYIVKTDGKEYLQCSINTRDDCKKE